MVCTKCGTINAEGTQFCVRCNAALAAQAHAHPHGQQQSAPDGMTFRGWGADSTQYLGGMLQLDELPPPPEDFGKVKVAFGDSTRNPLVEPAVPRRAEDDPFKRLVEQAGELPPPVPSETISSLAGVHISMPEEPTPASMLYRVVPPPPASRTRVTPVGRRPLPDDLDDSHANTYGAFEDLGDAGVEMVSTGFDGLPMMTAREADVFSDIGPLPGDAEPMESQPLREGEYAPPTPAAREVAVPPTSSETAALPASATNLRMQSPEMPTKKPLQRSMSTKISDSIMVDMFRPQRKPAAYSPHPEHGRTRLHWWTSIPAQAVLVLLLIAAISAAIWRVATPKAFVEVAVEFRNLRNLPRSERDSFLELQRNRLVGDVVHIVARSVLKERHPELEEGFLAEYLEYTRMVEASRWIEAPTAGVYTLIFNSRDPLGDPLRVEAMLLSLHQNNQDYVDKAARAQTELSRTSRAVERMQDQLDGLKQSIERRRPAPVNSPSTAPAATTRPVASLPDPFAGETLEELLRRRPMLEEELARQTKLLESRRSQAAMSVEPVPPKEGTSRVRHARDYRWTAIIVASLSIILLFAVAHLVIRRRRVVRS